MFALGGSDYHGIDREDERQPGAIPLPDAVVDAFLAIARERGGRVPGGGRVSRPVRAEPQTASELPRR